MSKKIGSFKDQYARRGHLGWTGDLEFHFNEVWDALRDDDDEAIDGPKPGPWGKPDPVLPHLASVSDSQTRESTEKHHLDREEREHHVEHGQAITGTQNDHLVTYKGESETYNRPLRTAPRLGGHLRIGTTYEPMVKQNDDEPHHNLGWTKDWAHNRTNQNIENINHLAKVTSNPTPKDMHVFRGIYIPSGIHRLRPGDKFTDHGFTGTSFSHGTAHSFASSHGVQEAPLGYHYTGPGKKQHRTTGAPDAWDGSKIVARIHVPAGTLGHYLDHEGSSSMHEHEEEFLLHRGTTFQIDRHEHLSRHLTGTGKGEHIVHMSVIAQHPKPMVNHWQRQDKDNLNSIHSYMKKMAAGNDLPYHPKMASDYAKAHGSSGNIYKMLDYIKSPNPTSNPGMYKMKKFSETLVSEAAMTKIGEPLGSNEGGRHVDENGDHHYVKHYVNPDQGKTEVLAGKIYQHMGIHTIGVDHAEVNGRPAVASRWNDKLQPMHHKDFENLSDHQAHQVGRMYHAAVLTKDWDVVGLVHDNIMKHKDTGDLHSVDHGAAFHFRARGSHKDYDPEIGEHQSLRHNDGASGHVFDHVLSKHRGAYDAGHAAVAGMDMDHVHGLFANSGLHNWRDLHSTFVSRRDKLLKATNS